MPITARLSGGKSATTICIFIHPMKTGWRDPEPAGRPDCSLAVAAGRCGNHFVDLLAGKNHLWSGRLIRKISKSGKNPVYNGA
jgi:hypothetical protein